MNKFITIFCFSLLGTLQLAAQQNPTSVRSSLLRDFQNPPESASPWVFWYWMQAAVTKEGITADLEAMKEAGIAGAYLMPIYGAGNPPLLEPVVAQQSPLWWQMVQHSMNEADRLGLKLAMHVSDGFALAGGPWITPELSMQKVVWTKTILNGGTAIDTLLPKPEAYEGYYEDIATFAYPMVAGGDITTKTTKPNITTSTGEDASFLSLDSNNTQFKCDSACWIQYAFEQPFTCRSIVIRTKGNNYGAQRLALEVSDDGKHFTKLVQFAAPRHGWQDVDADLTESIPQTTAKYYRFYYNKEGSEPGSEDLDAAKWKPRLKITGIELSGAPSLHQYEGKTGSIWRISPRTTTEQLPDSLCIHPAQLIDVSAMMNNAGRLQWEAPAGQWVILRIGHTSTGHTNATGGAARGLECDKFNPIAITRQFDGWFGEVYKKTDSATARKILKVFHVDSWECGSQNWSPLFREEFKARRGYDIYRYLPLFAGVPLASADSSEDILHDVRETIASLVADTFYTTLGKLAHAKGCTFSAESVAPTMTSDGLLHYKNVDVPMGEFWLRSPTHDKPNDMFDAISGAHIYGKNIIQAEGFTELKLMWDEYPAMLKSLQDRNYALGINRLVYHVFMHNPWLDRQPGMTLNGVGLFFQRDQTWWKPGKEWVNYAKRCHTLLQQGTPVADIAVFTGEEVPRRSILPDRLVATLPGLFGKEKVQQEATRLANTGTPQRTAPQGVSASANMADPEDWTNPLRGYAYDAINPDALLRLATVKNGRIVLPGGASYAMLVVPGSRPMQPGSNYMSEAIAKKLYDLAAQGATILINGQPQKGIGLKDKDAVISKYAALIQPQTSNQMQINKLGMGRVITGAYTLETLDSIGISRDIMLTEAGNEYATKTAYTHRVLKNGAEVYFLSNQEDRARTLHISLRSADKTPELWDAVDKTVAEAANWRVENGRMSFDVDLEPNGSVFIVMAQPLNGKKKGKPTKSQAFKSTTLLNDQWNVFFSKSDSESVTIPFKRLEDWSQNADSFIRYYSGTAIYTQTVKLTPTGTATYINLGTVKNIATVKVNGVECGTTWTPPYRVDITKAVKKGENVITVEVTNTWANKIIGDHVMNTGKTWTNAPYRLEGEPLLPSGLLGPISILQR